MLKLVLIQLIYYPAVILLCSLTIKCSFHYSLYSINRLCSGIFTFYDVFILIVYILHQNITIHKNYDFYHKISYVYKKKVIVKAFRVIIYCSSCIKIENSN